MSETSKPALDDDEAPVDEAQTDPADPDDDPDARVVAAIERGADALDIIAGELIQLRQAMQVKQQVKVGEETKENTIGFADVIGFFVNRTIAMDQAQLAQQSQAIQAAIAGSNHMPPGGRNRRG